MKTHGENQQPQKSAASLQKSHGVSSYDPGSKGGFDAQEGQAIPFLQRKVDASSASSPENRTGLPDNLKSGLEKLSGYAMDDVNVHYNSSKPAQLQAHAYAQGSDIHLSPGQERHLPHEAWHVVQQKQGRVKATQQLKSNTQINDDTGLEREADIMGSQAASSTQDVPFVAQLQHVPATSIVQRKIGFEYELDTIRTRKTNSYYINPNKVWTNHEIGERIQTKNGYDITADMGESETRLEFVTDAFDEHTEMRELIQVINDILADIQSIKNTSLANKVGYFAGTKLGGREGFFAGDGWVGANKVPRINGNWWHQFQYAAGAGAQLVGQLQMTAGLTLDGLTNITSGATWGNAREWPGKFQEDERQFITSYARHEDAPPKLFQTALAAVERSELCGDNEEAKGTFAGILAVMIQAPLSYRNVAYDGQLIAKTDYAKLLSLAVDQTRIPIRKDRFLAALLMAINANVDEEERVGPEDPVFKSSPELNLGKVNFAQWVNGMVPTIEGRVKQDGADLMTRQHYPGTAGEKHALRTFGPYADRTDDGDKAIFEFRSLMKNPTADLNDLVYILSALMRRANE